MKKNIFFVIIIGTSINIAHAQLSVSGVLTPTQLVQNILVGAGVSVSNVTFNGDPFAIGSFNGTSSNIGFNSGILLATGDIANAIGPNLSGANTTDFGTSSFDPDLTAIATSTLFDAAILEFDFVPMSDTLKFQYVFASEEYPEFVCSEYNDVFGFFITGPNPGGGNYTSQNLAIIPGSTLPVAINTVNPGVVGAAGFGGTCQSLAYSNLYVDNTNGTSVEYDGFTVPLTATAAVTCGQTYHIKIAIADVGDGAYDSGVFLKAGSFSSNSVQILPHISYGGPNDSVLYEGCGTACVYFVRTSNSSVSDTVSVSIGGTAMNGVDYNTGVTGVHLPTQIIFQPGQDTLTYCINAVSDGIPEGLETILLSIHQTSGHCLQPTTNATLFISDLQPLHLTVSNDTTICNPASVNLNSFVTGGVQPYTFSWNNGAAVANPSVSVASTTSFIVSVNDACTGNPDPTLALSDSIKVTVFNPQNFTVTTGNDITVCPDNIINLTSQINGGASPFIYNWAILSGADTISSANQSSFSIVVTTNDFYLLTVRDFCNNVRSDSVRVFVDNNCFLSIPNVITPDGNGPNVNEFFYIANLDKFPNSGLEIYNRWGTKLYETADYLNDWNGSKYSDGTYYYILTVSNGRINPGFFQIMRMK